MDLIDPTIVVDGKAPCPYCGGYYTVKADGQLRAHKCTGVDAGTDDKPESVKRAPKSKPTGRVSKTVAPDQVKRIAVASIGSGVEWMARRSVAASCDIPTHLVPDSVIEIPDDDAKSMIEPILNITWPKMPDKMRKVIVELAGYEELIDCFFAWSDYFKKLRTFTDEVTRQRKEMHKAEVAARVAAPGPTPTIMEESHDVFPVQIGTPDIGDGPELVSAFTPFIPDSN